jgi:hypothetical protein
VIIRFGLDFVPVGITSSLFGMRVLFDSVT